MERITVEDCLEKIENQYDLVLLAKERTAQLNSGAPMLVEEDNDRPPLIAFLSGSFEHETNLSLGFTNVFIEQFGTFDVDEVAPTFVFTN